MNETENPLDRASSAGRPLNAADLQQRCAERLERLGVRPGTSRRKLISILRKQEGRRITIRSRGEHGRLLGHPASTSALVDRRPERRDILVLVADPRRSARGRHALLHELSHLIVAPGGPSLTSQLRADGDDDANGDAAGDLDGDLDGDAAGDLDAAALVSAGAHLGQQYRCGCEDEEEREVEMTANLLEHYMSSALQPHDEPAASSLGVVLARRGSTHEPR
jgi:hypothetical protein